MNIRVSALVLMMCSVAGLISCEQQKPEQPKEPKGLHAQTGVLPPWQEGALDIHFINTGTGESAFIIMPDGTQMLVDMAGALTDPSEEMYIPVRRDLSVSAGKWISDYVSKCMQWTGNDVIDYVSITHYHGDHIGSYSTTLPDSQLGPYKMMSVADVLENQKIWKIVDRGYDFPYNMLATDVVGNYKSCIDWHSENKGLIQEKFEVSSVSQFGLRRNAAAYPDFRIKNIAVNGCLWKRDGSIVELFPDKSQFTGTGEAKEFSPAENHTSSVFKLSYGRFDYYAGGDISYNGYSSYAWKDAELPVVQSVGKVEVMKANHHGSSDANRQETLSWLSPQVVVVNVWRNVQPRVATLNNMISPLTNNGLTDVFTTNMTSVQEAEFGQAAERVLGKNGHVVIRVNPKGEEYYVYTLEDSDLSMHILKRFGPYRSR